MFVYTGSQLTPLLTQLNVWIASTAYVTLPEISSSKQLIFPYNKKYIISTLSGKILATFLIVLGHFFIVSPELTKYSILERFINIFLLIFIPWITNSFYIFLMMLLLYTLIDNLCEQLSNIPRADLEEWGWEKVEMLKKFQSAMNCPTFVLILVG